MERRLKASKGSNNNNTNDELALVKAAAWAWYQHGSGSEGRAMREYDLAMPKRAAKPSRYKIEAAIKVEKEEQEENSKISPPKSAPLSPLSNSSSCQQSEISLLDDYEIMRISKELDCYVWSSQVEYIKSFLGNKVVSCSETSDSTSSEKRSKQRNKNSRGSSWIKYARICGTRKDDVVHGRSFEISRSYSGRKSM